MMYRVVKDFTDLQDQNHYYKAGDIYPRDGLEVSSKRIEELSGTNNRQHTILIKAEEAAKETVKGTRKRKKTEV